MIASHDMRAQRLLFGAFLLCVLLLVSSGCAHRPPAAAIASAHPAATQAGMEILAEGGNAFDAAVAVSAVLAVVEPYSSGLGGGGFWLLHRAEDGHQVMVDGRERAPLAAMRDLYLDDSGDVVPGLSISGALAAGIPGEPAALAHIAEHYGRMPLAQSLAPAIGLARTGFAVDATYRRLAGIRLAELQDDPETAAIFLANGVIPPLGQRIVQADLAVTLEALAQSGRAGFYAGPVARRLVEGVRQAGGIWSLDDLAQYQVVEREPVSGRYRDLRVISAAPPSSGGAVLVTMLNILEGFPLERYDDVTRTHVIIEAMRRAYRDRALYLGDPDFLDVPVTELTSREYAASLRASIRLERATSSEGFPAVPATSEGQDTTHFSVLDRDGNRVAATLSINYPFGACLTPPGTGVLLNDEMDDFSAKPGASNVYGLVGAEANAIAPGKRPLSSMSPSFIESKDGVAILGTPGGSRIITMVLLAALDHAAGRLPESWVSLPRFHHQYLPDVIQYEAGAFDAALIEGLSARGHQLKLLDPSYGNMQAVYWDRKYRRVYAASDPRGIGAAAVEAVD
ncbi:MAG: gamma-glutamyltransferase [Halobacteria archaeon]|nr:gamma-glutamyltransferase [Halobacteria archaeon]